MHEIAARVKEAFRNARQGDRSLLDDCRAWGRGRAGLVPFLEDPDEAIRREVVILLKVVGGDAALPLLVRALTDASADIQERAATLLYERSDPAPIAAMDSAGRGPPRERAAGNPSAAALLLLAYFPGDETEKVLREEQARPPTRRPIRHRDRPVRGRCRHGGLVADRRPGRQAGLIEAIGRATLEELGLPPGRAPRGRRARGLARLKTDARRHQGDRQRCPDRGRAARRLCDDAVEPSSVARVEGRFAPKDAKLQERTRSPKSAG